MRLTRLATWCYRSRWRVLIGWVVALVVIGVAGSSFAADTADNYELPGTDSQRAFDTLAEAFPQQSGDRGQIVFRAADGVNQPDRRAEIEARLAEVASLDHVVEVSSPYADGGFSTISPDGTIGYATAAFDGRATEIPIESAIAFVDTVTEASSDTVQFEAGGEVAYLGSQPEFSASEGIGLLAAIVILLVAFGTLLAMGLPIATALVGIAIGLSLVSLLGHVLDVPTFAGQIAAMIGIGVGIDYALFIVTRYRTALSHDRDPEAATLEAVATAGRAVLFAGVVVVVALLGMLVMDFVVVRGVAVASATVVLVTMAASVTLLPALIGFAGHNINRFGPKRLRHDASHASARESIWFRWSRVIQRRPWPVALIGAVVLVGLTVPLLSLRLGVSDAGNQPESRTTRRAYDLLAQGFGPGFNGPFLVVADLRQGGDIAMLEDLRTQIGAADGIAFVSPPTPNEAGDVATMAVSPASAPQDEATEDVLRLLRDTTIPSVVGDSGAIVSVGGINASFMDFGVKIGERLPWFVGVVVVLSFLLLTAVFRSPLVALKAAILNLLSISAAYGIIVAIFQWGWMGDLIGIGRAGPIESWVPMMMFAILFGLSMDYEVFLLSRIREEYRRTGDNALAVADGLASTARVITAAAAIMIVVFLSFALGDDRILKLMGIGLASAIFVDATIVRLVLVPATMELLGDWNWWVPGWLDRLLPDFDVDGQHAGWDHAEGVEADLNIGDRVPIEQS